MNASDAGHGPLLRRLARWVCALSSCQRPLALDELAMHVRRARITLADVAPLTTLDERRYAHRAILMSRHLELGLIGWRSGQHSPTHEHLGSACCVLVLAGLLTNTEYVEDANGHVHAVARRQLRPGELLCHHGRQIHRISNEQPGSALFTLHLYSPPLAPMALRVRGSHSTRTSAMGSRSEDVFRA